MRGRRADSPRKGLRRNPLARQWGDLSYTVGLTGGAGFGYLPHVMILRNRTELDTAQLEALLRRHIEGWPQAGVRVFVRYSRSADFSGACYYNSGRLLINIGRHVRYPYRIAARIAPAKTRGRYFDQLRKHYPKRREFQNTRIEFSGAPSAEMAEVLAGLGFQIPDR